MPDIEKILRGVLSYEKTAGGIMAFRFSDETAWKGGIERHPAGVRLETRTKAAAIVMDVRLGGSKHPLARGAFDLFADGRFIRSFIPDPPYTEGQLFHFEIALPAEKEKNLVLYFPTYREVEILNLTADSELEPAPEYAGRIMYLGDSITHGYGATPGFCYAAQYARKQNKDFLNLAIGGACFPDLLPEGLLAQRCDELVIAYGCNDTKETDPLTKTERRLRNLLAFAVRNPWRITVLSPIHGSSENNERAVVFLNIKKVIQKTAAEFPGVHLVDGFEAFPNRQEFFVDGTHPNTDGMTRIAELLLARKNC